MVGVYLLVEYTISMASASEVSWILMTVIDDDPVKTSFFWIYTVILLGILTQLQNIVNWITVKRRKDFNE